MLTRLTYLCEITSIIYCIHFLICFTIIFFRSFHAENLVLNKDEVVVAYFCTSLKNEYYRLLRATIVRKSEVCLSALSEEEQYMLEGKMGREDETDMIFDLCADVLTGEEYRVIVLIYVYGYSTAEISKRANKSRQAVHKMKQRALEKLRKQLDL